MPGSILETFEEIIDDEEELRILKKINEGKDLQKIIEEEIGAEK